MKSLILSLILCILSQLTMGSNDTSYVFKSRDLHFFFSAKEKNTGHSLKSEKDLYRVRGLKIPLILVHRDTSRVLEMLMSINQKNGLDLNPVYLENPAVTVNLNEFDYIRYSRSWFILTENTTLADIEWLLVKATASRHGFLLATSLNALHNNPRIEEILEAIGEWEKARLSEAFPGKLIRKLRENPIPWHINRVKPDNWDLYSLTDAETFIYKPDNTSEGKPDIVHWIYELKAVTQYLQFQLTVDGDSSATCSEPSFIIGHTRIMLFKGEIRKGEIMVMDGSMNAMIYSDNGKFLRCIKSSREIPALAPGKHMIDFQCKTLSPGSSVKIAMKSLTVPERISVKNNEK